MAHPYRHVSPCIAVTQVELLELTGHPHQRRRWRADQHWAEERLNP